MLRILSLATLLSGLLGTPMLAQNVLLGSHSIDGALCAGPACSSPELILPYTLKLKDLQTSLLFEDTSAPSAAFANRDWALVANSDPLDLFTLRDVEAARDVVTVTGDTRANALFIAADGHVGLGTSLPQAGLHLVATSAPAIWLEQTDTAQTWAIRGDTDGFALRDETMGTTPFRTRAGAPEAAMEIAANGHIGLGTTAPEGRLHTKGDGVQLVYFESDDGDAVQVRFRTDSENRRFLAVNNANEVKSQIVFGDDQITFLGQTVAQEWLRISDAGIVSSGPTCNPNPCDATFDPDAFTVPAIEDRAAYMWENMHLPAVGPTGPETPFNVTEKMGGVIHELEVAHIYIEQLHQQLELQSERFLALEARLDALER